MKKNETLSFEDYMEIIHPSRKRNFDDYTNHAIVRTWAQADGFEGFDLEMQEDAIAAVFGEKSSRLNTSLQIRMGKNRRAIRVIDEKLKRLNHRHHELQERIACFVAPPALPYSIVPIGLVSILFVTLGAGLRWLFLDAGAFDLWQTVFSSEGELGLVILSFIMVVVLALILCGSVSLSVGFYHSKALYCVFKRRISIMCHCVRKAVFTTLWRPHLERITDVLVDQKVRIQKEIEEHSITMRYEFEKLEKQKEAIITIYRAGYMEGHARKRSRKNLFFLSHTVS